MKLNKTETEEVKRLVKKYQELDNRCSIIEEHIKRMQMDLEFLILEKNETKRDEVMLLADLNEKYGENVITPELLKTIII